MSGSVVQKNDYELDRIYKQAKDSGRYLITVTTLNEDERKLDHYIVTKEFPKDDIASTFMHFFETVKQPKKKIWDRITGK